MNRDTVTHTHTDTHVHHRQFYPPGILVVFSTERTFFLPALNMVFPTRLNAFYAVFLCVLALNKDGMNKFACAKKNYAK